MSEDDIGDADAADTGESDTGKVDAAGTGEDDAGRVDPASRSGDGTGGIDVYGDDATRQDDATVTRRALLAAAASTGVASTAGCAGVTTPAEIADATSIEANVGYFTGVEWLADNRGDVVVLDARSPEKFRTERIYGARRAPVERLQARAKTDEGLVPDTEAIAAAFESVGVAPDDDVIVYGASVGSRVTRVVFALEYLGHGGEVRILNGGFPAWTGRIGTGERDVARSSYDPDPRPDLVATRASISERLGSFNTDTGPGLIDVRVPEAYLAARGSEALVASNDRHGHIPGAIDVHWVGNVAGTELTDPSRLASLYFQGADVSTEGPVVVYGQGNVNATNSWTVLRALGVDDVRLYDGGFQEWANVPPRLRGECPVETKTTVVVETEGSVGSGGGGGFSCSG